MYVESVGLVHVVLTSLLPSLAFHAPTFAFASVFCLYCFASLCLTFVSSSLSLMRHLCKLKASSLWRAVAKVLHDEASLPMVRVTTLFMVSKQTLEPRRKN